MLSNIKAQATTFTIIETKVYALVLTLLTQDNVKLLKKLESGFKRTIKWNRYQSKEQANI